jgi:hypothetical protein
MSPAGISSPHGKGTWSPIHKYIDSQQNHNISLPARVNCRVQATESAWTWHQCYLHEYRMFAVLCYSTKGLLRDMVATQSVRIFHTKLFQFTKIYKEFERTIAFSVPKFSYRRSCLSVHILNWHQQNQTLVYYSYL